MALRTIDLTKAIPVDLYKSTTPQNVEGDNTPFASIDNRSELTNALYTDAGIVYQAKVDASSSTPAVYDIVDIDLTIATSTGYAECYVIDASYYSNYNVPDGHTLAVVVPVEYDATGNPIISYNDGTVDLYYCMAFSGAIDIPFSEFSFPAIANIRSTSTMQIGDPVYVYTNGDFIIMTPGYAPVVTSGSEETISISNSIPVAIGFIDGINYNAGGVDDWITIHFLEQLGRGPGVSTLGTSSITTHSLLTDIGGELSDDVSTWVFPLAATSLGHQGYEIKVMRVNQATVGFASGASASTLLGHLVELAYESSAWVIQKSSANTTNIPSGSSTQLLGVYLDEATIGGTTYHFIQVSGPLVYSTSTTTGDISTLWTNISTASISEGDIIYDGGKSTPGVLTDIKPIYPSTIRVIGRYLGSNTIYLYPANYIDTLMELIYNAKVANASGGIIQTLANWVRKSLSYDDSSSPAHPTAGFVFENIDLKKQLAGKVIDINNIGQFTSSSTGKKAYWFSISEAIDQHRVPSGFYSALTNNFTNLDDFYSVSPGAYPTKINDVYWAHLPSSDTSDGLVEVYYDNDQQALTFLSTATDGVVGKQLSPYEDTTIGDFKDYAFDSTDGTPEYKRGLPWSGLLLLAYAKDGTSYGSALFSYEGYTGYGTSALTLFNVNFFKKIDTSGNFVSTDWLPNLPGISASNFYDPTSSDYWQYSSANNPSWNSSDAGIWPSTVGTKWWIKPVPIGGIKLKIHGPGMFDKIIFPSTSAVSYFSANDKENDLLAGGMSKYIYETAFNIAGTKAGIGSFTDIAREINVPENTATNKDFDPNDANDVAGLDAFWYPKNSSATLKKIVSSAANALKTLFTNDLDITPAGTPSPTTAKEIAYPDDFTGYPNTVGSVGLPFDTHATLATKIPQLPGIIWLDPKEVWIDLAQLASTSAINLIELLTNSMVISVTDELMTGNAVDDTTFIEVTISQGPCNDDEDFKYGIDNLCVNKVEFNGLVEGDSIRFFVTSRDNTPVISR